MDRSDTKHAFHLVYFGPGLAGKTTSIKRLARLFDCASTQIQRRCPSQGQDHLEVVLLASQHRHTTQVPHDIHLHALVGNKMHDAAQSRALLEKDHAVIFVADAQPVRFSANLFFVEKLLEHIETSPEALNRIAIQTQLNKKDLSTSKSLTHAHQLLHTLDGASLYESIATDMKDEGVQNAFLACTTRLREDLNVSVRHER